MFEAHCRLGLEIENRLTFGSVTAWLLMQLSFEHRLGIIPYENKEFVCFYVDRWASAIFLEELMPVLSCCFLVGT